MMLKLTPPEPKVARGGGDDGENYLNLNKNKSGTVAYTISLCIQSNLSFQLEPERTKIQYNKGISAD